MPSTTAASDVFRVRSPGDLIELIPYLLGFHPRLSLVLVGLDHGRVTVTARADLIDVTTGCVRLADTVRTIVRSGARQIIAAVFDEAAEVGRAGPDTGAELIAGLGQLAAEAEVTLLDAVLVSRGRWWSYVCRDERCCPSSGTPLPGDASAAAATATYAGLVALPDRAEVMAGLEPLSAEQRDALEPLLVGYENAATAAILDGHLQRHQRSVKRAIFAAARDSDCTLFPGSSGSVSDDEVCRFAVALLEPVIRDAVWLALERRALDGRPLWLEIARRVPAPYDAAPLFLYGWASWRDGNGTLAAAAAERALGSDPAYRAADLLLGAVTHGLDPHRTPRLRLPRPA